MLTPIQLARLQSIGMDGWYSSHVESLPEQVRDDVLRLLLVFYNEGRAVGFSSAVDAHNRMLLKVVRGGIGYGGS